MNVPVPSAGSLWAKLRDLLKGRRARPPPAMGPPPSLEALVPAFALLFEPAPAEAGQSTPDSAVSAAEALARQIETPLDSPRRPVEFDAGRLATLRQVSQSAAGFDRDLASAQLRAAQGAFVACDQAAAAVLRANAVHFPASVHLASGIIGTALACQRPDVVGTCLSFRNGRDFYAAFEMERLPLAMSVMAGIGPDRICTIGFDATAIGGAHVDRLAAALLAASTLLARAAANPALPAGRALFTLADGAAYPGLGFCASAPGVWLVPDPYFVNSRGYADLRAQFDASAVAWNERRTIAFWRGTTTGLRAKPDRHWSSLQRIALCRLSLQHPDALDAGISTVVQAATPAEPEQVAAAGLLRGGVPATEFLRYRYQIDVDGNTNSWPGLYMKLLTGSPVLKIASPSGYRQWYYGRLLPWVNFVPVKADMSDLVDAIEALRTDDARALAIGEAGRRLALDLVWAREIEAAGPAFAEAFEADRPG